MFAWPPAARRRAERPTALLRTAWRRDKPLTATGVLMLVVLVGTVVGLLVDPRVITGAPAWLKPAKFAISFSIYCFTLLWMLTFIQGRPRAVGLIAWVTAIALPVEMALITAAAAAGTTSHFNVSSTVRTVVWQTMAVAIIVTWIMCLVAAVLLLRQRLADAVFALALRLGVIGAAAGMAVALLMTTRAEQGGVRGAHGVGVADGGPGLPIVNWSTVGGDLRAPHFIGLHALQLLPIVGYLIVRFSPSWLRPVHRLRIVLTVGLGYLGLVVLLTWQALRGQPLSTPDALTLAVGGGLVGVAVAVIGGVVVHARSTRDG